MAKIRTKWEKPVFYNGKLVSSKKNHYFTSSNHRLESAGLNALEGLLFKMLRMVGEDI